jgi:hypothetical protein
MAERYPPGKGPKCGNCPDCGGLIYIDWRCTILAEYHCSICGRVYVNYNGVKPKIYREEVKELVDALFNEIGEKTVDGQLFIKLVDQLCLKAFKNHVPVISKKDLHKWGYKLEYGMISKR